MSLTVTMHRSKTEAGLQRIARGVAARGDALPQTVDERQKVFRRVAMNALARREQSFHELQQKLIQQGASPDEARIVLERLVAENLQSDERFTEAMVRYQRQRNKGPLWIRRWLQEKGIHSDLIHEYLCEDDWLDQAKAIREQRFGIQQPSTPQEKARQMRFLAQRGFTAEQVRKVFR